MRLAEYLRDIFITNLHLKIFSLVIAIVLWLFVVVENQPEIGLVVPVEFVNIPKNMALINDSRDYEVEVRVRGPQALVSNLTSRQVRVRIDLSRSSVGETTFYLSKQYVSLPRGIKILRILPSQVKVTLEPIVERLIPVDPVVLGVPAKGYELVEVRAYPENVRVRGAKSLVEELKAVRTTSLDITGLDRSITRKVELIPPGEQIQLVEQPKIEVRAIIRERHEQKRLSSVQVYVLPVVQGAEVEPKTVDLVLDGPLSIIRSLEKDEVQALVNVQELRPGEDKLKVSVKLPEGVSLIKVVPEEVRVVNPGKIDQLLRPKIDEPPPRLPLPET